MKRTALLILMVVTMATVAKAQHGRFSLGVDLGFPQGDFGDNYDLGFGSTVRYEYPIGDKMGVGLTTGFVAFAGTSIDNAYGTSTDVSGVLMIPIMPYFRFYFQDQQQGFYAQGSLGLVHSSSASTTDPTTGKDVTYTSTDFSFGPEVGYALEHWDFGLRYQMIPQKHDVIDPNTLEIKSQSTTSSFIGLRVAYVFGSR